MKKTLDFINLYLIYRSLFTKRMIEVGDLYFLQDYIIDEIASYLEVSKSSISITIGTIKKKIANFEKVLKISEIKNSLLMVIDGIEKKNINDIKNRIKEVVDGI